LKNLLVTGAAGFIGAALAKRLLEEGHHVMTVDNLSTGFIENIPNGCEYIIGDLHDEAIIRQLSGRCFDVIYHIAGQSGGITSFDDPLYDMNANITSTLLLLDYARASGCNRFIYASSMSVYGDGNICPVAEDAILMPKSFYAVGKLASEHYMRLFSTLGIKATALRLNNIYGPGQNMANTKQGMASIYMEQALRDKHIHSLGSKERFRDFVYIDDAVTSFIVAGEGQEEDAYNIYNVATGIKTTVESLVEKIRNALPFDVSVEYRGETPGDQFGIYCDYSRIAHALGWEPKIDLTTGINKMIKWAIARNECDNDIARKLD